MVETGLGWLVDAEVLRALVGGPSVSGAAAEAMLVADGAMVVVS